MDLIHTPSHPKANSYCSLAFANEFMFSHTDYDEWNNISNTNKERLLIQATASIQRLNLIGNSFFSEPRNYRDKQHLHFPLMFDRIYTGFADTVSELSLISINLKDQPHIPSDLLNEGGIVFTEGTGRGQTALITDFDSATGTISFEELDTPIAKGSQFIIFLPVNDDIREATVLQAMHLYQNPVTSVSSDFSRKRIDDVEVYVGGSITSIEKRNNISSAAFSLLSRYIDRTLSFR